MTHTDHDHRSGYCPRLGHEVPFAYCRAPGEDSPCARILDCWWERFDVRAFIAQTYGTEAIAQLAGPPPSRVEILTDAILKARAAGENRA